MLFNKNWMLNNNPFTRIYGIGRTLLSLSLLITFLFNSADILFDETIFYINKSGNILNSLNFFTILGYENIIISKNIASVILIVVTIGIYPRYTGVIHWWITFSYLNIAAIVEGGDQISAIITLLLIPITILDPRKNHWDQTNTINNWFFNIIGNSSLFLIKVQVSILYFHASIEKMYKLDEWIDGTAVYYFLKDKLFGCPDWMYYLISPLIESRMVFFVSWSVIIIELLLAFALFSTVSYKNRIFVVGLFFHLLIALFFGLVSFFFSMSGALTLYLLNSNTKLKIYERKASNLF